MRPSLNSSAASSRFCYAATSMNQLDLRAVTPTLCSLMDVPVPALSSSPLFEEVVVSVSNAIVGPVERCLIFAADAIGARPLKFLRGGFERLTEAAAIEVRLRSVHPSITPVCFASMFTGASPEAHGIQKGVRPV